MLEYLHRHVEEIGQEMKTDIQRFETKYIPVPESGCWIWLGSHNSHGYGQFHIRNRGIGAHCFSYEHYCGSIPQGMTIDHLCRVRSCVNPHHLRVVSNRQNVLSGIGLTAKNAIKTHCARGHEFDLLNTIYRRTGGRRCRACRVEDRKK